MIKRPTKITEENVLTVDVAFIAQDRRFDNLKFENIKKKLPKIQEWLREAHELGAQDLLIPQDLNTITNITKQLITKLDSLLTFEIRTTNDTALREHNSLESQLDEFYNTSYQQLPMRILPFLRNETARKSTDKQELEKQQKAAVQAEQKYKELSDKLETRFQELNRQEKELDTKKRDVESGHAELAAVRLAKHFEEEVKRYEENAVKWLKIRSLFYWGILILILIIAGVCFKIGWDKISYQLGIAKIIFLSAVWYGLSFATRNYNINSHLAAVNRHRSAVARTMEDFISSKQQRQSEIFKNAAEAMFKNASIGFISRTEREGATPIHEIINNFFSSKTNS